MNASDVKVGARVRFLGPVYDEAGRPIDDPRGTIASIYPGDDDELWIRLDGDTRGAVCVLRPDAERDLELEAAEACST